jgi:hypothetical protein
MSFSSNKFSEKQTLCKNGNKEKIEMRYEYRILREEVLHYKSLINWRSLENTRVLMF